MNLLQLWRWRRDQRRLAIGGIDLFSTMLRSVIIILLLLIAHTVAMVFFEGFSLGDAAWLTLTTVTTVGYGDLSATTTAGRWTTVVLLYFGGIFLLGKTAGDYFDYRLDRRERKRKGQWRWHMKDHLIVINTPVHNGKQYCHRLLQQLRHSRRFAHRPIQLLTERFADGLPQSLLDLGGVTYYQGNSHSADALQAVNVHQAAAIVVLVSDEFDPMSDGRTFDILHRFKEMGVQCPVLAECIEDNNRQRLLNAGASQIIRPIRAYPEMVVRALSAPGSEQIIENFFTSDDDEYHLYHVTIDDMPWKAIVTRIIEQDLGLPIAFRDRHTGQLVCNPSATHRVFADELFVIVDEKQQHIHDTAVKKALVPHQ